MASTKAFSTYIDDRTDETTLATTDEFVIRKSDGTVKAAPQSIVGGGFTPLGFSNTDFTAGNLNITASHRNKYLYNDGTLSGTTKTFTINTASSIGWQAGDRMVVDLAGDDGVIITFTEAGLAVIGNENPSPTASKKIYGPNIYLVTLRDGDIWDINAIQFDPDTGLSGYTSGDHVLIYTANNNAGTLAALGSVYTKDTGLASGEIPSNNAILAASEYVRIDAGGSGLESRSASETRTDLSVAQTSQTFQMSGLMAGSISNDDYRIILNLKFAGTITETTTRSTTGTATATFKVNTTALGGTANAVSTAEQSQAHASSNTFVAGDDIVITISAASSVENISVTIAYTRTLA